MKAQTAIAISLALTAVFRLCFAPSPAHAASLATTLQTSAVIPAGSGVCVFDSGGPFSIDFPATLDPFAPVPVTTASVTFNVTCTGLAGGGKTVIVTRDDGSQLYLKSGVDKIAYSLSVPFSQNAKNKKSAPFTVTATILADAYKNAAAGFYSDTITINVMP